MNIFDKIVFIIFSLISLYVIIRFYLTPYLKTKEDKSDKVIYTNKLENLFVIILFVVSVWLLSKLLNKFEYKYNLTYYFIAMGIVFLFNKGFSITIISEKKLYSLRKVYEISDIEQISAYSKKIAVIKKYNIILKNGIGYDVVLSKKACRILNGLVGEQKDMAQ